MKQNALKALYTKELRKMNKEDNLKRTVCLKNIILNMPEKPGTHQFHDNEKIIIYIGRTKNPKRRAPFYFHKEVGRFKTKMLVSKIYGISYSVAKTKEDVFPIGNQLIKQYKLKYNVLLKGGETYLSICVTNEHPPRIFKTRTINKCYGASYGPYSHIGGMYAILGTIKKVYKPCICRSPITKEGIEQGKYKPCSEYHLHNCGALCINKQSYEDYQEAIKQVREILRGNTRDVQKLLKQEMEKYAGELRFEEVELCKQRYLMLDNFVVKSEIVSHTITDVDVFAIVSDDTRKNVFINYIHVANGTINQNFTYEYKRKLDESDQELLNEAIPEICERFNSTAKEVTIPFELDFKAKDAEFFTP